MKNSSLLFCVLLEVIGISLSAAAQEHPSIIPLHDPQADYPGSPEKPLTRTLISQLSELNSSGRVFEAWLLLAQQNDGYAKSATRIFGKKITVEKCVVEGNWKNVVGEEVRSKLYLPYAQLYQHYYIEFLKTQHRYPNTLEIETMYRNADDALGLPQSVSVDLMMNLVPTDWKRRIFFDDFSSLLGIGQDASPKYWYHYTKISPARVSKEFITAQDIDQDQAKKIYKKSAGTVAKCMAKKLKPSSSRESHE